MKKKISWGTVIRVNEFKLRGGKGLTGNAPASGKKLQSGRRANLALTSVYKKQSKFIKNNIYVRKIPKT
jgi:hypothetical protein